MRCQESGLLVHHPLKYLLMKKIIVFASLSLFFLNCKSTKQVTAIEGVDFVPSDNLTDVLEMAASKDKLVFVDFYTTWCLPCKLMDEDVFTDKNLGNFMNDNFISYKIDAEKGNGPNLALLYQVNVFPTLLFLDERGRVVVRKEGAAYQTELRSLAEEAMANVEENVGD